MNATAIRGLLSGANVLGVLLVGWLTYATFYTIDRSRYEVPVPVVREVWVEARTNRDIGNLERYQLIWQVFDPAPPPEPVEPGPPEDEESQDPPPPVQVDGFILDSGDPPDPDLHTVFLTAGSRTSGFRVGDSLEVASGFERFSGWTVREIRPKRSGSDEVVWEVVLRRPDAEPLVLVREDDAGSRRGRR